MGIHLPVHISHGRGISHSNMMPVNAPKVHIKTTTPMIIRPTRCDVLSATLCRNTNIEHFDTLRANTKRIVETKTLTWICSRLCAVRRHPLLPRPTSVAVEIMIVVPKPHSEAATRTMSSAAESWRTERDWHRLMILIAVQSAW
jgi:hypothetical protein